MHNHELWCRHRYAPNLHICQPRRPSHAPWVSQRVVSRHPNVNHWDYVAIPSSKRGWPRPHPIHCGHVRILSLIRCSINITSWSSCSIVCVGRWRKVWFGILTAENACHSTENILEGWTLLSILRAYVLTLGTLEPWKCECLSFFMVRRRCLLGIVTLTRGWGSCIVGIRISGILCSLRWSLSIHLG